MTVLQQVRDYYTHLVQPSTDTTRKMIQRIMTDEGVKTHPTPQDYHADRLQRFADGVSPQPARLLSEQA